VIVAGLVEKQGRETAEAIRKAGGIAIVPGPIMTAMTDGLVPPMVDRDAFLSGLARRMVPLQRLGAPSDVAGVALFLASDLSAFVTSGRTIVGGGIPLAPMNQFEMLTRMQDG
jgi:NAD(P)-dependent dehydrogenase (short-subunit alcohol dehydrogenase family)